MVLQNCSARSWRTNSSRTVNCEGSRAHCKLPLQVYPSPPRPLPQGAARVPQRRQGQLGPEQALALSSQIQNVHSQHWLRSTTWECPGRRNHLWVVPEVNNMGWDRHPSSARMCQLELVSVRLCRQLRDWSLRWQPAGQGRSLGLQGLRLKGSVIKALWALVVLSAGPQPCHHHSGPHTKCRAGRVQCHRHLCRKARCTEAPSVSGERTRRNRAQVCDLCMVVQ